MPVNLTGETYALVHADELQPKEWGLGADFEDWWPKIESRLAKFSAVDSPFVLAVSEGTAPRPAIDRFVKDLVLLAKEIPLHESRIAARVEHHGENSVLIMASATALGLGYAGFPYMPDLARTLASAWGIGAEESATHELSPWAKAYLNGLYYFGRYAEMGVAATLVDAQWEAITVRLRAGLTKHYGVADEHMTVFEALAAMDRPRIEKRPLILKDMARTAYHQFMVLRAVKSISSLWRRMWDAWLDPDLNGLTFPPNGAKG